MGYRPRPPHVHVTEQHAWTPDEVRDDLARLLRQEARSTMVLPPARRERERDSVSGISRRRIHAVPGPPRGSWRDITVAEVAAAAVKAPARVGRAHPVLAAVLVGSLNALSVYGWTGWWPLAVTAGVVAAAVLHIVIDRDTDTPEPEPALEPPGDGFGRPDCRHPDRLPVETTDPVSGDVIDTVGWVCVSCLARLDHESADAERVASDAILAGWGSINEYRKAQDALTTAEQKAALVAALNETTAGTLDTLAEVAAATAAKPNRADLRLLPTGANWWVNDYGEFRASEYATAADLRKALAKAREHLDSLTAGWDDDGHGTFTLTQDQHRAYVNAVAMCKAIRDRLDALESGGTVTQAARVFQPAEPVTEHVGCGEDDPTCCACDTSEVWSHAASVPVQILHTPPAREPDPWFVPTGPVEWLPASTEYLERP